MKAQSPADLVRYSLGYFRYCSFVIVLENGYVGLGVVQTLPEAAL
jgi:hypothetical protein